MPLNFLRRLASLLRRPRLDDELAEEKQVRLPADGVRFVQLLQLPALVVC